VLLSVLWVDVHSAGILEVHAMAWVMLKLLIQEHPHPGVLPYPNIGSLREEPVLVT